MYGVNVRTPYSVHALIDWESRVHPGDLPPCIPWNVLHLHSSGGEPCDPDRPEVHWNSIGIVALYTI